MFWISHINNISSCDRQQLERYLDILTAQELARYHGFSNSKKRDQFLLGRVLMRIMLSQAFHEPPSAWHLTPNGPLKIIDRDKPVASINLSHSNDYVLCGVQPQGLLGVDIQYMDNSRNTLSIAQHYYCAREVELMERGSETQQRSLFYRFWCLKEAMAKAHGKGILGNMQGLCIQQLQSDNVMQLIIRPEFQRNYSIASLTWEKYTIALVAENQLDDTQLRLVTIHKLKAKVDQTLDLKSNTQHISYRQAGHQ